MYKNGAGQNVLQVALMTDGVKLQSKGGVKPIPRSGLNRVVNDDDLTTIENAL